MNCTEPLSWCNIIELYFSLFIPRYVYYRHALDVMYNALSFSLTIISKTVQKESLSFTESHYAKNITRHLLHVTDMNKLKIHSIINSVSLD
jgi:hypothetical protein